MNGSASLDDDLSAGTGFCGGSGCDLRWSPRDWLGIAVLAVLCLAIRVPALSAVWLGVDQQQYSATAAYLNANGNSAFSDPYGPVHTFELYRVFAAVFGPYSLFSVRLFVLFLALGTSVLLFSIVRRAATGCSPVQSSSATTCSSRGSRPIGNGSPGR